MDNLADLSDYAPQLLEINFLNKILEICKEDEPEMTKVALVIFSNLIQDKKISCVEILATKTEITNIITKILFKEYEPYKLMRACIWILYEIINEHFTNEDCVNLNFKVGSYLNLLD